MSILRHQLLLPSLKTYFRCLTTSGDLKKLRRFYNHVTTEKHSDNKWSLQLDGRDLKTPAGNIMETPTESAALLVAHEWEKQKDWVQFDAMPITNLAIQALDLISHGDTRRLVEAESLKYIQTDSTIFQTSHADSADSLKLAQWQKSHIAPVHRALESRYSLSRQIAVSTSLSPPKQYQPDLDILASILVNRTVWELSCLFTAVRQLKSYLVGVALMDELINVDTAIKAANTEELFHRETWGSIEEHHNINDNVLKMWLNAAVLLNKSVLLAKVQ